MEAAHLVVGRLLRPHGLKGEAVVEAVTDHPDAVFVTGRRLVAVDDDGAARGVELVIAGSRRRPRDWLLTFGGIASRTELERLRLGLLAARSEELAVPGPNAMYVHEIAGSAIVEGDRVIGVARELVGSGSGAWLVMETNGQEHLIPFRHPIVLRMDRVARRIEVALPPGLLEVT